MPHFERKGTMYIKSLWLQKMIISQRLKKPKTEFFFVFSNRLILYG